MLDRNPILIGKAEEIDLVQPQVRRMLEVEGVYIGTDTMSPEFEVPLVVIGGKVFSMKIDQELAPERFKDTLQLVGPFRGKGSEPQPDPGAPSWAKCADRCQRMHPHCQLRLTRDIAPDSGWHWAVEMPDGHLYDASKGPMTFEQALADMQKRGVVALDAADAIWRRMHPVPAKELTDG